MSFRMQCVCESDLFNTETGGFQLSDSKTHVLHNK